MSDVILIERLAGAAAAIACVLAALRFAIVQLRSFAGGPLQRLSRGPLQRLADGPLQRLADGPLQRAADVPFQRLARGPFQRLARGLLQHLADITLRDPPDTRSGTGTGTGSGSGAGAGSKAWDRNGRVLAILESAYLPGAASVHLVRAGPRLLVIGRSGGAIVTLCELEADAHSHR